MLLTKIFPMIVSCNDYFFILPFLLNLSFLFSYFYNQMYRKQKERDTMFVYKYFVQTLEVSTTRMKKRQNTLLMCLFILLTSKQITLTDALSLRTQPHSQCKYLYVLLALLLIINAITVEDMTCEFELKDIILSHIIIVLLLLLFFSVDSFILPCG